jgi:hypothetical protein
MENDQEYTSCLNISSNKKAVFGFAVTLIASFMAGLACVTLEKLLKSNDHEEVSVWMRIVKMTLPSLSFAFVSSITEEGAILQDQGLFYGVDNFVWFVVVWCSIGKISLIFCIKFTDCIQTNIATTAAIVFGIIISSPVSPVNFSLEICTGTIMTVGAMLLYRRNEESVDEMIEMKADEIKKKQKHLAWHGN